MTDWPVTLPLKRKVTSTIGLTELIPVARTGGMAEPLASGYLSLTSLTRSDGWIVVPAESEGFAAGTPVAVRAWP
jgi:molybdopterin biosynthesis enzyme